MADDLDRLDEEKTLAEADDFAAALGEEVQTTEEAVEEAAPVEDIPSEDEPSKGDGPSAEMIAVGKLAGVPAELLNGAKDNAAVSAMIDWVKGLQQQQAAPQDEEEQAEQNSALVEDLLGEQYDEDDPTHRQLKHLIERANEVLTADRRAIDLLLRHANAQIQREEKSQAARFQEPYDLAIDELDSPVLGNSFKGLTPEQIKLRSKVFQTYADLIEDEPAERHKEIAQNLITTKYSKLLGQTSREQKREQQSLKRIGGRSTAARPDKLTDLDAFEQALLAYSQK